MGTLNVCGRKGWKPYVVGRNKGEACQAEEASRLSEKGKNPSVGSVVFLQLGVVFAVLAFIFSEAWGQYNEAAQSIDLEVSAMHGVGMVAATLRPAQASTILAAERA